MRNKLLFSLVTLVVGAVAVPVGPEAAVRDVNQLEVTRLEGSFCIFFLSSAIFYQTDGYLAHGADVIELAIRASESESAFEALFFADPDVRPEHLATPEHHVKIKPYVPPQETGLKTGLKTGTKRRRPTIPRL